MYWDSVGLVFLGAVLIAVGLAIWFTAFVLVPLGLIFVIVGLVKAARLAMANRSPGRGSDQRS